MSSLAIIFDGAVRDAKCALRREPAGVEQNHLESRLLSSAGKGSPGLTGPPLRFSLISQERKITDFRALRRGLPFLSPCLSECDILWRRCSSKRDGAQCSPSLALSSERTCSPQGWLSSAWGPWCCRCSQSSGSASAELA